jgi:hypothetical protein
MVSFITSKTPSRIDEGCSNGLWAGFRISMEQDLPPSYPFSVMRPDQIEASFHHSMPPDFPGESPFRLFQPVSEPTP